MSKLFKGRFFHVISSKDIASQEKCASTNTDETESEADYRALELSFISLGNLMVKLYANWRNYNKNTLTL